MACTSEQLDHIGAAEELRVSNRRADGTLHKPKPGGPSGDTG